MFMRPVRPLAGEVLLKQFGKSFAVIGDNATGSLCPVFRKEIRKKVFQFIAATTGKLLKQVVCPVGTVNFIRVIEEIMRILCWSSGRTISRLSGKSPLKPVQIIGYSFCRKVVHHISFTTGSSTLHFLKCFTNESGNQPPLPFRGLPYQLSIFHLRCQIIKRHCFPLFRSRSVSQYSESHQLTQFGIRTLFFIRHFYLFFQAFTTLQCIFFNQQFTGSIFYTHLRATERPACTCVHINLHTQACSFTFRMAQHLHPPGSQELNFVCVITLHPIDRSNFHRAHPGFGICFQIAGQVSRIYRTPHPPPASTRFSFRSYFGPCDILCGKASCTEGSKDYCQ